MDTNHTQSTASHTQNTLESTQEQEFSDDGGSDGSSEHSSSQVSSSNSKQKQFPAVRPCSKYDSDSHMSIIQGAYDASFVTAQRKKANIEKRHKMKKSKAKKMNKDVATVQQKCQAAAMKTSNDTIPPKKRYLLKNYEPVDEPGQTKLTTFVTPAESKYSLASISTPSQVLAIQKVKNTLSTLENLDTSVSFKSPEPFAHQQPSIPVSVGGSGNIGSVSTVGTPLLPLMLACCIGVCSGCSLQFHQCHKAKWRETCLHAVVDYFDCVGYDMITKHGICEAYYDRYIGLVKTELLAGHGYYKLDDDVLISSCMLQGSLQEALQIEDYNTTFQFLEQRRMHGVKGYVKNRNNPPEVNKKRYGEE